MSSKQPIAPLHGAKLGLAAVTIGLASFMAVVDITIANVSVPTIAGNLGVGSDEGEWIITSFAIANAICIPLTGWLGRRFGQVRLFVGAVAAFTIISVLCGLAWSFDSLLLFRILQGAVAGPIVPLSQALLVAVFPADRRTLAIAMWAMTNMAGPVAGPLLGGWITDNYSWPWIFFVNAPIGLFVVALTTALLNGRDTPATRLPVDLCGLALLAFGIGSLQVTLDRGRTLDWFSSPFICTTATVAAIALVTLVIWELGEKNPILDLRLFARRNFAVGTTVVAVGFGVYFASLVLIPLWLQTNLGYNSTWAGLVTAPMGLFGVLLAPFLGRWVAKGNAIVYASIAFVAWAAVAWWRSGTTTNIAAGTIALSHLAQGIGIGFFLTPVVSLSLVGMPADKVASASGLQTAIRMMSGSLVASLAQTFWDHRSRFHHTQLVERLNPFDERANVAIASLRSAGLSDEQAWSVIARGQDVQSHMLALNDFFFVSAFAFLAALGILWLARPPRKV